MVFSIGNKDPSGSKSKRHVLIVGAGIAGISTAYWLSQKQNFRVTVVDRRSSAGLECSFRNGGLLCPSLSYPWCNIGCFKVAIKSMLETDVLKKEVEINWNRFKPTSKERLKDIFWLGHFIYESLSPNRTEQNYRNSLSLCRLSMSLMRQEFPNSNLAVPHGGSIQVFESESARTSRKGKMEVGKLVDTVSLSEKDMLEREACLAPYQSLKNNEVMTLHNVRETLERHPLLSTGEDSSGDIHKFTHMVKESAEKRGCEFRFNESIDSFIFDNSKKKIEGVKLSSGSVLDDITDVVIAAGNGAPELGRLANDSSCVYSMPVKGYVLTLKVNESMKMLTHNVVDDIGKFYVSPLNHNTIRVSAFAGIGFTDTTVKKARAHSLERKATNLFKTGFVVPTNLSNNKQNNTDNNKQNNTDNNIQNNTDNNIQNNTDNYKQNNTDTSSPSWHCCLRPQTPDDLPYVGPAESIQNLYYNSGHGHIGYTRAFGASFLLANIISNTQSPLTDSTLQLTDSTLQLTDTTSLLSALSPSRFW